MHKMLFSSSHDDTCKLLLKCWSKGVSDSVNIIVVFSIRLQVHNTLAGLDYVWKSDHNIYVFTLNSILLYTNKKNQKKPVKQ